MPFAVSFERGSKIGRVVLAITICAGYLIVDRVGVRALHGAQPCVDGGRSRREPLPDEPA